VVGDDGACSALARAVSVVDGSVQMRGLEIANACVVQRRVSKSGIGGRARGGGTKTRRTSGLSGSVGG